MEGLEKIPVVAKEPQGQRIQVLDAGIENTSPSVVITTDIDDAVIFVHRKT